MMLFRIAMMICCICCLYCCSDEKPEHLTKKYSGVYIENSLRYGRIYIDPNGLKYIYRYIKVNIINDSLIPLQVNMAFSKTDYSPTPDHGKTFRVFLLPDTMSPENQQSDDFYKREVIPFLNAGSKIPLTFQKVIQPKESCLFNLGFLSADGSHLEPMPMALFSKGHSYRFNAIPESAIAQAVAEHSSLNLFLGLDFSISSGDTSKPYALIPCGSLSFSHP